MKLTELIRKYIEIVLRESDLRLRGVSSPSHPYTKRKMLKKGMSEVELEIAKEDDEVQKTPKKKPVSIAKVLRKRKEGED